MAGLATQESLAALTAELLSSAAGWDDAALATVAAQTNEFARVVASDSALRRTLVDPTVEDERLLALVHGLVDGKVDARTATLLSSAATHRWNSGREFVAGLRQLSRTITFVRAERSGTLDEVEDELFRFGRIVDASPELSLILDDGTAAPQGRAALVETLLADRADAITTQLLVDVARDGAGDGYTTQVAALVELAAQRRDKLVATATSAVALGDDEVSRLARALERIYGRQVAVHVVVDAALQGGIRVRVGDELIDGSVSARLTELRQRLA